MSFDIESLNDEQKKAVYAEGAVLVTAGAGSGKTRLLTHRIAHLVIDNHVPPYNILAITFTNKAASEMRERLAGMIDGAREMLISTFHSMCVRILRRFVDKIGYTSNFSIYGDDEKERAVKALLKKTDNTVDDMHKRVMWSISDAKNNGLTPDQYRLEHKGGEDIDLICDCYALYEKELKRNNALDFDDLLVKTYLLLKNDSDALNYCQERFRYIHVDEFQDTNTIQYKLIKLMASKYRNIFVVGDEDQCIYGWRGANFQNIYDYKNDFNCQVFKLERNYRSTKKILTLANTLIGNNTSRLDKKLWTDQEDGEPVEVLIATSEANEADIVVNRINKLAREYGYKYSDVAILMRLNALTRSFEERMVQYGIPYKIFGGFKFFERKEIKDILAYLKIISNPKDEDAVTRVINFPKRGIGDGTILQIRNYAAEKGESFYDALMDIRNNTELSTTIIRKVEPFALLLKDMGEKKNTLSPVNLVLYLIDELHLKDVYADDTDENINRKRNIDEFVSSVGQYCNDNESLLLEDYLQMITLYSDLDGMDNSVDYVNVATVHSAKGLEFKAVFVIGMEDGVFPINRATNSLSDLEEERRLFYVAITRAKERLYISRATSRFLYGNRKSTYPSRFLKEIGIETKFVPRVNRTRPQIEINPITPTVMPVATKQEDFDASVYHVGTKVQHRRFGPGVVTKLANEHNGCYAEIEFEKLGKITLALAYAPLTVLE